MKKTTPKKKQRAHSPIQRFSSYCRHVFWISRVSYHGAWSRRHWFGMTASKHDFSSFFATVSRSSYFLYIRILDNWHLTVTWLSGQFGIETSDGERHVNVFLISYLHRCDN